MAKWQDSPEWYQDNYINLVNKQRFCKDYWDVVNKYRTFSEAIKGRGLRFALYSVYVAQRERHSPWRELETILADWAFPRDLYASYCRQLFHTGRLSRQDLEMSLRNIGITDFAPYMEPVNEHWTKLFEIKLSLLSRDHVEEDIDDDIAY